MNDYLCNEETGDLLINNGDFVRGASQDKNTAVLARSPKGSLRKTPLIGVGAISYKNAPVSKLQSLVREFSLQMDAVGFKGASVNIIEGNKIEINV